MCEELRNIIEEKKFYLIVATESSNILYEYKHPSFTDLSQQVIRLFITSVFFTKPKPLHIERMWLSDFQAFTISEGRTFFTVLFNSSVTPSNLLFLILYTTFLNSNPHKLFKILKKERLDTERDAESFTFREIVSKRQTNHSRHFSQFDQFIQNGLTALYEDYSSHLDAFLGFCCDREGYLYYGALPGYLKNEELKERLKTLENGETIMINSLDKQHTIKIFLCSVLNGLVIGELCEERREVRPIRSICKTQIESSECFNYKFAAYLKSVLAVSIPRNKKTDFSYFNEIDKQKKNENSESKRKLLEKPVHSSRRDIENTGLREQRNASERLFGSFVYQHRFDKEEERTLRNSQILKSKSTIGFERFRLITVEELEIVYEKTKQQTLEHV